MRAMVALVLIGWAAGAQADAPPDKLSDNYFRCVVGNGTVAILHGASAKTALKRGEAACGDSIRAIFKAYGSEGDVGALLMHDHDVAGEALAAIEARFKP